MPNGCDRLYSKWSTLERMAEIEKEMAEGYREHAADTFFSPDHRRSFRNKATKHSVAATKLRAQAKILGRKYRKCIGR